MPAHILEGGCHCGNIRYRYHSPIPRDQIPVRSCGCTFCMKSAGCYTSHPEGGLEGTVNNPEKISQYKFGTSTAVFFICSRCGSVPFITSNIDDRDYAVLNINTLDGPPLAKRDIPVSDFDGETKEGRLARRKQRWISSVAITMGNA